MSVLKSPRDVNASAVAHASKSKLLCSHQISASIGRAEVAVTKPASFKWVCSYCKEPPHRHWLFPDHGKGSTENKHIGSHAAVLLKEKLCKNVTLWLPGQSCCFNILRLDCIQVLTELGKCLLQKPKLNNTETLRTSLAKTLVFALSTELREQKQDSLCYIINRPLC